MVSNLRVEFVKVMEFDLICICAVLEGLCKLVECCNPYHKYARILI